MICWKEKSVISDRLIVHSIAANFDCGHQFIKCIGSGCHRLVPHSKLLFKSVTLVLQWSAAIYTIHNYNYNMNCHECVFMEEMVTALLSIQLCNCWSQLGNKAVVNATDQQLAQLLPTLSLIIHISIEHIFS